VDVIAVGADHVAIAAPVDIDMVIKHERVDVGLVALSDLPLQMSEVAALPRSTGDLDC
jgi:hypothetical protein